MARRPAAEREGATAAPRATVFHFEDFDRSKPAEERDEGMRGRAVPIVVALVCAAGGARGAGGASGAVSACFDTREVDLCIRFAAEMDDRRQNQTEALERQECEQRLVSADGKGVFACASDDGAAPAGDVAADGLRAELAAAVVARRRGDADAIYRRMVAMAEREGAHACTAACNAEGRERLRLSQETPSLVRRFDECMSTVEGGRDTCRRAEGGRETWRRDAEARCRAESECDALERLGLGTCTHAARGSGAHGERRTPSRSRTPRG